VPVVGVLLVRNESVFAVKFQSADAGVQALRNFCYWIAVRMVSRPGLFSLIAVLIVASLGSSTPICSRATGSRQVRISGSGRASSRSMPS